MSAALLFLLAWSTCAAPLGGPPAPDSAPAAPSAAAARRRVLQEMWRRGILPPDQTSWSPADDELLGHIREAQARALDLLLRTFGGYGAWAVRVHRPGRIPELLLTRRGYDKYREVLTQDAIDYFVTKGAEEKWVFKLTDWEGKRLFDGAGLLTPAGERVYALARRNEKVFWRGGGGEVYGTRRPPSSNAAAPPPLSREARRTRLRAAAPRAPVSQPPAEGSTGMP